MSIGAGDIERIAEAAVRTDAGAGKGGFSPQNSLYNLVGSDFRPGGGANSAGANNPAGMTYPTPPPQANPGFQDNRLFDAFQQAHAQNQQTSLFNSLRPWWDF